VQSWVFKHIFSSVFFPLNVSIYMHLLAGGIWVIGLVCMSTNAHLDVAIKASSEYE